MGDKARLLPAALAGFALIRREPLAVISWGLLYFIVVAIPAALMFWSMLPIFEAAMTNPAMEPPPEVIAGLFSTMGVVMLFYLALLVVGLMICNAVWRAVLFPERRSWMFLRLGVEEGRTFLVGLVLFVLMYLAAPIPMTIVMVPGMALMFGPMAELAQSGVDPESLTFWDLLRPMLPFYAYMLVAQAIVYLGLAWPFARLALALPMTMAEGRLRIFDGWAFSRGYGWSLWGMLVLVWVAVTVVEYAVMGGFFWWAMGPVWTAGLTDPALFLQGVVERVPVLVGVGGAMALVFAILGFPVTLAPLARAYQLIAGAPQGSSDAPAARSTASPA